MLADIEPWHVSMIGSLPKAWIWSRFSSACSLVVVSTMARPLTVDLRGDLLALFDRMAEQLLHHRDDVLGSVVLIVPQDDVVARLPLGLFLPIGALL